MQGKREHEGNVLEGLDPRRRTYYWIEEGQERWVNDEMSDVHAMRRRPRFGDALSIPTPPTTRLPPSELGTALQEPASSG